MNLDQIPSYLVPCKKFTMAKKGSNNVTIHGCNDKRMITATFVITLSGAFLPMQLIYGGKTLQSLPRYQFPHSFSLSVNPKQYSNTTESLKLLNEIIIPYVKKIRSSEDIPNDQYSVVIMDVFTRQKTSEVLDLVNANKILVTNVPRNMTKFVFFCFFFSVWVFFYDHSRITEQQGKGEGISLTPQYHFHPLHRHSDISRAIAAESSPLHVASSRTRTGNLWFLSASR